MSDQAGIWMRSPLYDCFWMGFSAWIPIALYLPLYYALGSSWTFPLYLSYFVIFGLPHVFMTWALAATPTGRTQYEPDSLGMPVFWALVFATPYLWTADSPSHLALFQTFVAYFGFYHVLKQHMGFHHIYWSRYGQLAGRAAADAIYRPLHHLLVAGSLGIYFGRMNGDRIHIQFGTDFFDQWYPEGIHLVGWGLLAYASLALTWAVVRVWRGWCVGLSVPWPSFSLVFNVLACFAISMFAVKTEDLLLAMAIFTSYHNLQYWGFVWHYYQSRCHYELAQDESFKLDALARLVASGQWKAFMGVAYAYTFAFALVLLALPPVLQNFISYLHQILHYTIDGRIWKRRYNPSLPRALGAFVRRGTPAAINH